MPRHPASVLLFLFFTAMTAAVTSAETAPALNPLNRSAGMKIFLLIGQSNMAGRGQIEAEDKVPHPRVFVLNKELAWVPAVDPPHFDAASFRELGRRYAKAWQALQ